MRSTVVAGLVLLALAGWLVLREDRGIEIMPRMPEPPEAVRAPAPLTPPVLGAPVLPPPREPAPPRLPGPRVRVVIDPGHGGKDPGGHGKRTTDREVASAVAAELRALLAGDARIEALFTRHGDVFVPLEERIAVARGSGAAAFVSLHANVWRKKGRAAGLEVAYPSERLARGELTRLLEAEGLLAKAGAPEVPLTAPSLAAAGVLVHTQTAARTRSEQLARALHDHLVRWTGQHGRGIRPGDYRVLRPRGTPVCLIELGFLTDAQEEELMMTRVWQQRAARGIRDGLTAWLDTPPSGAGDAKAVDVAELVARARAAGASARRAALSPPR